MACHNNPAALETLHATFAGARTMSSAKRKSGKERGGEPTRTKVKEEPLSSEDLWKFNQADYDTLRAHYFDPVVVKNVELPGGRTLREQKRPPRIEQDSDGFKKLRGTLKVLREQGDDGRIYQLLRQLRDWEIRPQSLGGQVPTFMREGAGAAQDQVVAEVIDLSALNDDDVVDVDAFILEVLLVGVMKVGYARDGMH